MYCPTCGADSVEGLKYCKHCGANITSVLSASLPKKFPLALTITFLMVILGIFTVGLSLPIAAARELVVAGFSHSNLMDLFAADLGLTLLVVGMLVWLFLRLIKVHQQTSGATSAPKPPPSEYARGQIVSPPHSIGSVTENTTRSFEPRVYDNLSK